VWVERGGKKKLVAAFHFSLANPAGWNCGDCRAQGLEKARRCGYLSEEERGPEKLVWLRGRVSLMECPTSAITGESERAIELFHVWKQTGQGDLSQRSAREAESVLLLENEWKRELEDRNRGGEHGH
jgi:hypothetical protein